MTQPKQFRAIKGTRDILRPIPRCGIGLSGPRVKSSNPIILAKSGCPFFEETALFARSIGAETDIVGKEMFAAPDPPLFADPEFTAGWGKLQELAIAHDPALAPITDVERNNILHELRLWTLAAYTSMKWSIDRARDNLISFRPEATASVCAPTSSTGCTCCLGT